MNATIIHLIEYCDLRCQHRGLTEIAKRKRIEVAELEVGDFIAYLNVKRTKVKILSANGLLVYLRHEKGTISMKEIEAIPTYFYGKKFIFQRAAKMKLKAVA